MARYLNAEKREDLLWISVLYARMMDSRGYYSGEEGKWLDSILLSIEVFIRTIGKKFDPTEERAIWNMLKQVHPSLYIYPQYGEGDKRISVNPELIYDLAEDALQNCLHECEEEPKTCARRKRFLDLGIPPLIEQGPCQYWRKGEDV